MDFQRLYEAKICPACGFQLDFMPWADNTELEPPCPCCGIHFGYDDATEGLRWQAYEKWRRRWVDDGMRWWSNKPCAAGFNPAEQLARLDRLTLQSG